MGYVTITNELVDELSPHEILVYLAIKRHYPKAHPSQQRLAEVSGLSLAAVERGVRSLRERGLVLVRRTGRSNWYVVLDAPLTEGTDPSHRGNRSLSQRDKEEQVRNPSEEDKTPPPLAGREEIRVIGEIPGEDPAQALDKRLVRKGTQAWCLRYFHNEAVKAGHPSYNAAALRASIKRLREKHGYTYDEIELLMRRFFIGHEHDVKTTRTNLVYRFNDLLPQMMKESRGRVEAVRSGSTVNSAVKSIEGDIEKWIEERKHA